MMSNGTAAQWATLAGYIGLALIGIWAGRYPSVRPWGLGGLSWALNNILFYTAYLIIGDGVLTPFLINWSAVTRLHGIFLAAGGLVVAVLARRGVGHD